MIRVLVGLGRNTRSATGGCSGSFFLLADEEESRALFRSALRSTAFGRRLPSGGPSIPLPPCMGGGGVHTAPRLLGLGPPCSLPLDWR